MGYRKFDIGEKVRFDVQSNTHYVSHNNHEGKITSIESYPKLRGAGTVVVYEMLCDCGRTLHPQAHHVKLVW